MHLFFLGADIQEYVYCDIVLNTSFEKMTQRFVVSLSATVFNNANEQINVYGDDVEVDYRGYEVRNIIGLTVL